MTWTKTGDEFADECWTLSDAAYRLHHEGLTWSNRKHLDGRLPKDEMHRWCKNPEAATELTDNGWWEDADTHYQIVHHIGYQPTAESVRRRSLANQANVQKRWANRKGKQKPRDDQSYESYNESYYESKYEGDGSGRDGTGPGKEPDYVSRNGKNLSGTGVEPPTVDADGFPLDYEKW